MTAGWTGRPTWRRSPTPMGHPRLRCRAGACWQFAATIRSTAVLLRGAQLAPPTPARGVPIASRLTTRAHVSMVNRGPASGAAPAHSTDATAGLACRAARAGGPEVDQLDDGAAGLDRPGLAELCGAHSTLCQPFTALIVRARLLTLMWVSLARRPRHPMERPETAVPGAADVRRSHRLAPGGLVRQAAPRQG